MDKKDNDISLYEMKHDILHKAKKKKKKKKKKLFILEMIDIKRMAW